MEITINKEKTCCFTGHRDIAAELEQYLAGRITDGIRYLYSQNIRIFLTGGAIGFDSLAAKSVLKFRETHADIRLMVIQPCQNQSKGWSCEHIETYKRINSLADRVVCLSEHYYRGCMHQRNRYLIDNSSVCICYLTRTKGGTAYTVKYAKDRGLSVYNLAQRKQV